MRRRALRMCRPVRSRAAAARRPHPRARRARHVPAAAARQRPAELKRTTPGWRARRWVIEACHSWLNCNRALLIRWSKKPENHLALLQLACGLIAFKKAHAARLAHTLSR